MQHAARTKLLEEIRKVLGWRIIAQLGLFFGVQVIEVAEEFVEAMHRRQMLVTVAKVVLAELAGAIALAFHDAGNGRVLVAHPGFGARKSDLGQTGAHAALAGDEAGAAGGAALLGEIVGEQHPLFADRVDVGRAIAHHPLGKDRQVGLTNVIPPHDQDIRLSVRHHNLPS